MPRAARVVAAGAFHHVTQRGNNRQDVFFVEEDRRAYLEFLREQGERFGLEVHGYCLMANHIHLIVRPDTAESLARAVGRAHWLYTQYANRLHGRSGHLWQNRFFSCPLDSKHFWYALRYVEQNPVRAQLARRPWEYAWSSAAVHVGEKSDAAGVLSLDHWRRIAAQLDWRAELLKGMDEKTRDALRLQTRRGRPLGSDSFVSKLETTLGRRLRANPVGRPKGKDEG